MTAGETMGGGGIISFVPSTESDNSALLQHGESATLYKPYVFNYVKHDKKFVRVRMCVKAIIMICCNTHKS